MHADAICCCSMLSFEQEQSDSVSIKRSISAVVKIIMR